MNLHGGFLEQFLFFRIQPMPPQAKDTQSCKAIMGVRQDIYGVQDRQQESQKERNNCSWVSLKLRHGKIDRQDAANQEGKAAVQQ